MSPLCWAALSSRTATAEALLIAARDNSGTSPLRWAALSGRTATVEALLAKGADIAARDDFSFPPVEALDGHTVTAAALLAKGADPPPVWTLGWRRTKGRQRRSSPLG